MRRPRRLREEHRRLPLLWMWVEKSLVDCVCEKLFECRVQKMERRTRCGLMVLNGERGRVFIHVGKGKRLAFRAHLSVFGDGGLGATSCESGKENAGGANEKRGRESVVQPKKEVAGRLNREGVADALESGRRI